MTLYRPHRGSLADAMREVVEVNDFAQLVRHMRRGVESWYPPAAMPTMENTTIEPYGFDDRIGWDTHIVLVKGEAWGFTNGALTKDEKPNQKSERQKRADWAKANTLGGVDRNGDYLDLDGNLRNVKEIPPAIGPDTKAGG
jgi:hypothetical protein